MTTTDGPLAGCVMVITADRRKQELASALERRGATVQFAAAISTIGSLDDERLVADTRAVIAHPPHVAVITTGIGMRGWLEAADAAGIRDELIECLRGARLVARGPKARGAIQAAGLDTYWVAQGETAAEIREFLLAEGVTGLRIAVQHHGTGSDGLDEAFIDAGAEVQSLLVYGSGPPAQPEVHQEWVHRAAAGAADAVLFTSAPAAQEWLATARRQGDLDAVVKRSAHGSLVMAAVGPVTARPLEDAGITVLYPERWRMGALIRELARHYGEQSGEIPTTGGALVMRATTAVLDGRVLALTPTALGMLRALADADGNSLTAAEVSHLVPGSPAPTQTVHTAIEQLRDELGDASLVRAAPGDGYSLGLAS